MKMTAKEKVPRGSTRKSGPYILRNRSASR